MRFCKKLAGIRACAPGDVVFSRREDSSATMSTLGDHVFDLWIEQSRLVSSCHRVYAHTCETSLWPCPSGFKLQVFAVTCITRAAKAKAWFSVRIL